MSTDVRIFVRLTGGSHESIYCECLPDAVAVEDAWKADVNEKVLARQGSNNTTAVLGSGTR